MIKVNLLCISARFNAMQACPNSYFVIVIEDTSTGELIGSATLAVEQKFIRGTKCVSFQYVNPCHAE